MGGGGNESSLVEDLKSDVRQRAPQGGSKGKMAGNSNAKEFSETKNGFKYQQLMISYPQYISQTVISFLVFLMAATMRADWLLMYAFYSKSSEQGSAEDILKSQSQELLGQNDSLNGTTAGSWNDQLSELLAVRFAGLTSFAIPAFTVSYIFFFGIGGFLHVYYYILQRHKAKEWKCQPDHWLSTELELHEIAVGFFSLNIGSLISSLLACWVFNGGWSMIYLDWKEYGLLWFFLQWPLIFAWQDYLTYWAHRIYHMPFLYKSFHKLHHTYKHPTAFSVTAIHPVEMTSIQMIYISPMFLFPIHFVPFSAILIYTYYHGIIDHSGINFKRHWWQPWQPDCIFHDNHHQYFHVNFGFNIEWWDMLHGTYRRKDRIYSEDIFWGTGKDLKEATKDELEVDLKERVAENPKAYREGKLRYALSEDEKSKLT